MPNKDKNTEIPQCVQPAVSVSAFLNGTAKEDFKKWYQNRLSVMTYSEILNINDKTVYSSLIIEWFDSIEFYINIEVIKDKMLGYVRGFDADVTFHLHGDLMTVNADCLKDDIYNTRDEAVLKSIQKANEVYNVKFFQAEH